MGSKTQEERAAKSCVKDLQVAVMPNVVRTSAAWMFGLLLCATAWNATAAEVDASKLPPPASRSIDFVRDIQPIFSTSCYSCHGPEKQKADLRLDVKAIALQGGMSGSAIRPGQSAESLLIHLVAGLKGEETLMPQKGKPLTLEQIGLLRAWIDQGAKWPDGLDPANYVNKREHWAFKMPARLPPPHVNHKAAVRTAIDHFILARLEKENLSPSAEADRRTLIRRLCLDVQGLPPSPEEVEQFVQDNSPDAWERLVDRVLASPRYGERWARHWLDVVRFAETHGFETNTPRNNAWPYRDYIIRAFNEDKPFTQFILEQLAGDAFGVDEATGFIVGGAWDEVKSPDIVLTSNQRADELHDIVSTTGSAFLGLTVGCARCHNHKFDPISQVDYYAMKAVFAGVQHGERKLKTPDSEERLRKAEAVRQLLHQVEGQLTQFEPLARPLPKKVEPPSPRLNEELFEPVEAKFVRFTIHETVGEIEPCLDELEIYTPGDYPRNVALASAGAKVTASGTYPNSDIHKLEHINDGQHGNNRSWISNDKGRGWVQIELPEKFTINKIHWGRDREEKLTDRLPTSYTIEVATDPRTWTESRAGLPPAKLVAHRPPLRPPVQPRQNVDRFAPVETKFLRFTILDTTGLEPCLDELEIYTAGDNPRNVALASAGAKTSASSVYPNSPIHKLEHLNDGFYGNSRSWISSETSKGWVQIEFPDTVTINKVVWGRDREEKFSDRLATNYKIEIATDTNQWRAVANSHDRQAHIAGQKFKPGYSAAGLNEAEAGRLNKLLAGRKEHETKIKELTGGPVVYAGNFAKPEPTHRLHRGDPMQKREEINPGALSSIGHGAGVSPENSKQAGGERVPARETVVQASGQRYPLTPSLSPSEGAEGERMPERRYSSSGPQFASTDSLPKLDLPANTPDQERRLALARWVADPRNPLTARVMVNRIWHYHFGQGLVNTPSDFGINGARPTHAALLDWLALEFMAQGWKPKAIHRLILLSHTYRQDSAPNPQALALDAGNRLLWRFAPRRLEAEPIRDSILWLSGKLDLKMGGPGYHVFEPNSNYVRVYNPKQEFGPPEWRRMIYQYKPRMQQDATFGTFDCPDGGQITPKRTSSTTALQALNLLNSRFILQQAGLFTERLEKEAGQDHSAQVQRAFALAFGREPVPEETAASMKLIQEHGLAAFCRAVLNANEFLYLF